MALQSTSTPADWAACALICSVSPDIDIADLARMAGASQAELTGAAGLTIARFAQICGNLGTDAEHFLRGPALAEHIRIRDMPADMQGQGDLFGGAAA